MTKKHQPTPSHRLTESQIITIETGLEWIKEKKSPFVRKLYERLLRNHPALREPLITRGFPTFKRAFGEAVQSLASRLRTRDQFQGANKEHWTLPILEFTTCIDRGQFDELVETFLEVIEECVEDAWCPAVEKAWRTAIGELKLLLMQSGSLPKYNSELS